MLPPLVSLLLAAALQPSTGAATTQLAHFQASAVRVSAASWTSAQGSLSLKNRFLCAVAASSGASTSVVLHPAFAYYADTGTCLHGEDTCFRAAVDDTTAATLFSTSGNRPSIDYLGCYDDGTPDTLAGASISTLASTNSPEICASVCLEEGKTFAGLRNGEECHCGSDPPLPDRLVNHDQEPDCDSVCPGDSTLTCGGSAGLSIYQVAGGGLFRASSTAERTTWGLQSSQHASTNVIDRAVDGDLSTWFGGAGNSEHQWIQVEFPAPQLVKGLRIIGTRWNSHSHMEVRVGDTDAGSSLVLGGRICSNRLCYTTGLQSGAIKDFDCANALMGKFVTIQKYSHRGQGSQGFAVYELDVVLYCDDAALDQCDVHGTEPADSCGPDEWIKGAAMYVGCFAAGSVNVLVHGDGSSTPEWCAQACWINAYAFSAVEEDQRCVCGRAPPASSDKVDEALCDMDCTSDSSFKCGGNGALSLYHTSMMYTMGSSIKEFGCYDLSTLDVDLGTPHGSDNEYRECGGSCTSLGYIYSGMGGASGEGCSCSNSEPDSVNQLSTDADDATHCPVVCPGLSNKRCGGTNRLSVFKLADDAPTVTMLTAASDKASWTATSSESFDPSTYPATAALDDATPSSFFLSKTEYPWLQVDFQATKLVRGVVVLNRLDCCEEDSSFLEVRVGDDDAGALTPDGVKFCKNRLCYTTGVAQTAVKSFLCATSLRGRYLSVQKSRQTYSSSEADWIWSMSVGKIDVFE